METIVLVTGFAINLIDRLSKLAEIQKQVASGEPLTDEQKATIKAEEAAETARLNAAIDSRT